MAIILRTCHNLYLSAEAQDFADRAAKKSGLSIRGEIISAVPIFLAGIADIYFILTESFDFILIVSAIALARHHFAAATFYSTGLTRQRYDRCGREPLTGSARSVPIKVAGFAPFDS